MSKDDFLDMLVEKGKDVLEKTLKPMVQEVVNTITHTSRYYPKTGKFSINFSIKGLKK